MSRIAAIASFVGLVAAHGYVNSPPARVPGDAYRATCGQQPFFQQSKFRNWLLYLRDGKLICGI